MSRLRFAIRAVLPLLGLTVVGAACACARELPQTVLAPNPAAASVRVQHDRGGATGNGSGTIVAVEDGVALVVTNRHVAPDPGQGILVWWPSGYRGYARWLGVDDAADLCALAVTAPADCVACPLAEAPPAPGQILTLAGWQGGPRPVPRSGAYLGVGGFLPGDTVHHVAAPSLPGDSGSGAVTASGELVAVVWGGRDGVARCVGRGALLRFLRRPMLLPRFPRLHMRLAAMRETVEPPVLPQALPPQRVAFYYPFPAAVGCPGGSCPAPARRR